MQSNKRSLCPKCERPDRVCLCEFIQPFETKIHFLILRHKTEVKHAFNTAKLCALSISNLLIENGEDFSHNETLLAFLKHKPLLVYPGKDSINLSTLRASKSPTKHFILIDGTWSKANKIYLTNKILHNLPKLLIDTKSESDYLIRKSNKEGGISTLECVSEIGRTLDCEVDYSALDELFLGMVSLQKSFY